MWYQVVQPSVQNKVIALIVPLLQFDICFLFQISSRVCEKCCQIFWISAGHLQTFQIIQRITQRYFQVTQKKSLYSKTWLWSCFGKWNYNPIEKSSVQEWGAEGLVWVSAVHARGDPLLSSWRGLGQVRDSIGISKLPQIQLTLPFKSWFYLIISAISASSEIPLLSLDQVSTWGHWEVSHHRWRVHLHLRRLPQSQQLSQWRLAR